MAWTRGAQGTRQGCAGTWQLSAGAQVRRFFACVWQSSFPILGVAPLTTPVLTSLSIPLCTVVGVHGWLGFPQQRGGCPLLACSLAWWLHLGSWLLQQPGCACLGHGQAEGVPAGVILVTLCHSRLLALGQLLSRAWLQPAGQL